MDTMASKWIYAYIYNIYYATVRAIPNLNASILKHPNKLMLSQKVLQMQTTNHSQLSCTPNYSPLVVYAAFQMVYVSPVPHFQSASEHSTAFPKTGWSGATCAANSSSRSLTNVESQRSVTCSSLRMMMIMTSWRFSPFPAGFIDHAYEYRLINIHIYIYTQYNLIIYIYNRERRWAPMK